VPAAGRPCLRQAGRACGRQAAVEVASLNLAEVTRE